MSLKIGVLATIAALVLGGCSNVVDGRAVISVPRPGSPIQWTACKAAESDSTRNTHVGSAGSSAASTSTDHQPPPQCEQLQDAPGDRRKPEEL